MPETPLKLPNSDKYRVVLGSSSPRRRELLGQLGLSFEVIKPDFDEVIKPNESASEYALRNAVSKGRAVRDQLKADGALANRDTLVISADTIVLLAGELFEKPEGSFGAEKMLAKLSGQTHTVMTALALLSDGPSGCVEHVEAVETQVTFRTLKAPEISAYVATGEPLDKSGGYALQGRAGYMVSSISGSHSNVIGLPLSELVSALTERFGWNLWSSAE